MSRPIYVLGSGLSHDGSSVLLADGEVAVAVEKERLTRKKHDGFNDMATLRYCLDAAGIDWPDIVLFVENNTVNRHEVIDQRLRKGRHIPEFVPRANISHHLAHAWSAAVPSGFDEAAVIVADGRGSSSDNCVEAEYTVPPRTLAEAAVEDPADWWEKESLYHWSGGRLRAVVKDFSRIVRDREDRHPMCPPTIENGIAEFYGGVTHYVFGDDFAQGKLMGLAPYGNPEAFCVDALRFVDGRVELDSSAFNEFDPARAARFRTGDVYDDFQYYADVARWAQDLCHEVTIALLRGYREHHPCRAAPDRRACAQCGAQRKDHRGDPVQQLFVQPAAGDSGVALDLERLFGWCEILGRSPVPLGDYGSCFGIPYAAATVAEAVADLEPTPVDLDEVAALLDGGAVVAVVDEGGQRSVRERWVTGACSPIRARPRCVTTSTVT